MPWTTRVARRFNWKFAVLFFATAVLAYITEHGLLARVFGSSEDAQFFFGVRGAYQQLVTAGPRKPTPKFSALITLSQDSEPADIMSTSVCRQRAFVADLLAVAERSAPSVIVIDKFYSPEACGPDDVGTKRLREAIANLGQARIPVVIARRAKRTLFGEAQVTPGKEHAPDAVELEPTLQFRKDDGSNGVIDGLANFAEDTRRAALGWYVREPGEQKARFMPTVALAAAAAREPDDRLLAVRPRLKRFLQAGTQPFVSFVPATPTGLLRLRAMDVLCHGLPNDVRQAGWEACAAKVAAPLSQLRGMVVVVGEASEADVHPTPGLGDVMGAALHQQYVEAVLDERIFTPAGFWPDTLFGFLIYAAVEYLFARRKSQVIKLAAGLVVVLGGAALVVYVLAINLGILLQPLTVSVVLICFRSVEVAYQWVEHYRPPAVSDSSPP